MQTPTRLQFRSRYDEIIQEYFDAIHNRNIGKLVELDYIFEYDVDDDNLFFIAEAMSDALYNAVEQNDVNFVHYFYGQGNNTSREEEVELYNIALLNNFRDIANLIRNRRSVENSCVEKFKTVLPSLPIINNDVCSICLGDNNDVKLDCSHEFHIQCLKDYKNETNKNQCPNCRAGNMLFSTRISRLVRPRRSAGIVRPRSYSDSIRDDDLSILRDFIRRNNTAIRPNKQEEFKTILPSLQLKNDDVCSICLDNNNDTKLDCGHEFHIQCLKDYKKGTNKHQCPNCRAENMLYGSKKKRMSKKHNLKKRFSKKCLKDIY